MKKLVYLLCVSLVLFTACKKESETIGCTLISNYTGTFYRNSGIPGADYVTSSVTLQLNDNSFSGTSSQQKYPAICQGTYTFDKDHMYVTNSCVFDATTDMTLVFDGQYNYIIDGNKLTIWREYTGGKKDVYELIRQ